MNTETKLALVRFLVADPEGFESALINTIHTYRERQLDARREQADRDPNMRHDLYCKEWAIGFLADQDNGENS